MAEASSLTPRIDVDTHWGKGSLGSEIVDLECRDPAVLKNAVEVLSVRFRKVYMDVAKGIAMLMAPTRRHDQTSQEIHHLVLALAACKSIAVAFFGGGRWESASGDRRTEPDQSFYVGDVAAEYRKIKRRGNLDEIEAFEETHPATLVVEVEHTHHDPEKRRLCRDVGIGELWEIGTENVKRPPAIVDLQARGGPREIPASSVVTGARSTSLRQALAVLEEIGGLDELGRRFERDDGSRERLMRAAGMEMQRIGS